MFNFLKKKQVESIKDYKSLLKCIKKLRKLNAPTPITEKFEGKDKVDFVKTTWYENQGEHWEGWVGGYSGSGFIIVKTTKEQQNLSTIILCVHQCLFG